MALLAPLTVAELEASVAGLQVAGPQAAESPIAELRELHELLIRATPSTPEPPRVALAAASVRVEQLGSDRVDALDARPRTAFRLIRVGAFDAAWAVLAENAIGVVGAPNRASTATGAPRTAWRLPLLTRLEPPAVYAELPGFRDPRYDVADDCYDISSTVTLRLGLDEVVIAGAVATLGGWAALDVLATGPEERVRLLASTPDADIVVTGRRVRRPDLETKGGDGQVRRAWAGWSASIDLGDPRLVDGSWELSLEVDHDGISRRSPLAASAGVLARAATRAPVRLGARTVRWHTALVPWRLVVTAGA